MLVNLEEKGKSITQAELVVESQTKKARQYYNGIMRVKEVSDDQKSKSRKTRL
jgi:hypothetical protein